MKNKRVIIIDDEIDLANLIKVHLEDQGLICTVFSNPEVALHQLQNETFDYIICDIHMPGINGLDLLNTYKNSYHGQGRWICVTANADPEIFEKAFTLGVDSFLSKPFVFSDIDKAILAAEKNSKTILEQICYMISQISGLVLDETKKSLVETRILRRMKETGHVNFDEYFDYFNKYPKSEIRNLVSVLTTHTTYFFREENHFDYLYNEFFPKILKENKQITIWSAACSTGKEVYSIAMCFLEYCHDHNVAGPYEKKIRIIGTDIDHSSIEECKKAIYPIDDIKDIDESLIKRYFLFGEGEYSGSVKIDECVTSLCSFQQLNLLSDLPNNLGRIDIIFARNIFIYFSKETIHTICRKFSKVLNTDGMLILGHSESIRNLDLPFRHYKNSIYYNDLRVENNGPVINPVLQKNHRPISVFIVDDSSVIRKILTKMFQESADFIVVGEAADAEEAQKRIKNMKVDLMTLDIHMPIKSGLEYLKELPKNIENHPKIIFVSSATDEEAKDIFDLEHPCVLDFISKPESNNIVEIGEKIRSTALEALRGKKQSADSFVNRRITPKCIDTESKDLILIGASTGGIEAITAILEKLDANCPPIVIVQHIPPVYSKAFANRLNDRCALNVFEGTDNKVIKKGEAYIAPGGMQMGVKIRNGQFMLTVLEGEKVNRFKPSVDYMFNSTLDWISNISATAILLTGMGADGAIGLKNLRSKGVFTIAQDEASSVVFGMPKEAIRMGGADVVLNLNDIANNIYNKIDHEKDAA